MPTYLQDLSYTMHSIQRVTHQLKVIEAPVIPSNQSKLVISIIRTNSGKEADGGQEALKLKINGNVVYDTFRTTSKVPANGSDEVFTQTHYVSHNSNGSGQFTISVEYKCDYIEGWGAFSQYWTYASADMTKAVTPIDQSTPLISNFEISADRYGYNAQTSFIASHSVYPITQIQFTLSGLTSGQASSRAGKATQADSSKSQYNSPGSYSLILTKTKNLTESNEILFDLNAIDENAYPLDSGKSYSFALTVTAQNNKTTTISGILAVPQKVTGVSCESALDIMLGGTDELSYTVEPANSELMAVSFHSTDEDVATVNEQGVISAIGDGVCQIVVVTADGNFSAACNVTVMNTEEFPRLSQIRYLTVKDIARLSFACNFLREKMIDKGLNVSAFSEVVCEGKGHPVTEIRSILEAIETNCQILKSAVPEETVISALPATQKIEKQNINWYVVVNEWIAFLNELNGIINLN